MQNYAVHGRHHLQNGILLMKYCMQTHVLLTMQKD